MTKQRDDLLHVLGKCYEFYDKKPNQAHVQIWLDALHAHPVDLIAQAFQRYYATGQYMPRPVQILALLDELKARKRGTEQPAQSHGQRSPEIAQAWITYIRFAHDFELPSSKNISSMPISQALEIVNREAARLDRLDAIKLEHRIDSYWGEQAA